MLRIALCLGLLVGCQTVKHVGGEIGGTAAEWIACPLDVIDCGHVYMYEALADNPLGHVELCVDDEEHDAPEQLDSAERMYGTYELTPRHQGLCVSTCEEPSPLPDGKGCNAYNGCWCW